MRNEEKEERKKRGRRRRRVRRRWRELLNEKGWRKLGAKGERGPWGEKKRSTREGNPLWTTRHAARLLELDEAAEGAGGLAAKVRFAVREQSVVVPGQLWLRRNALSPAYARGFDWQDRDFHLFNYSSSASLNWKQEMPFQEVQSFSFCKLGITCTQLSTDSLGDSTPFPLISQNPILCR